MLRAPIPWCYVSPDEPRINETKNCRPEGWRNDSAVSRTADLVVGSSSVPSTHMVTPVPGASYILLRIPRALHVHDTRTYRQTKHEYTSNKNKLLKTPPKF